MAERAEAARTAPAPLALLLAAAALLAACDSTDTAGATSGGHTRSATASTTASATSSATSRASARPPSPAAVPPMVDRWGEQRSWPGSLEEQNALMLDQLRQVHRISDAQRRQLEAIITASERIGQGNPKVTRHALSPKACRDELARRHLRYDRPRFERICGSRYMAPLFDPAKQQPTDARACIDQLEFPDIPCVYPVTWVRASEAVKICQVLGKRLCDAHEWEGACAGALLEPDYDFGLIKRMNADDARKGMRRQHNLAAFDARHWAYGPAYRKGICATAGRKSKKCGVGWRHCGSNTYPAGSFPRCVSPLGVYDLHGNAAEHMNLPLSPDQMASSPEQQYGYTEMKGSWFIFDRVHAHDDWCRWRAPGWHVTRVTAPNSHRNYHLGFRCCKSLGPR